MKKWIWLSGEDYPEFQRSYVNTSGLSKEEADRCRFCVTEFKKEYCFTKNITHISMTVSADTFYRFWLNGTLEGIGPPSSGGDFSRTCIMPRHYSFRYEKDFDSNFLSLFAQVRLTPCVLTEFSRMQGGFYLEAHLTFEDGSTAFVGTDSGWQVRYNPQYTDIFSADFSLEPHPWAAATELCDLWNAAVAPIPPLYLGKLSPEQGGTLNVAPGETRKAVFTFDMIYAGYISLESTGCFEARIKPFELEGQFSQGEVLLNACGKTDYLSLRMYSIGGYEICVKNSSDSPVSITAGMLVSHYPVEHSGCFESDDEQLNLVHRVCAHTLKTCRQSLHLDSPKHQELLACTGDYYIESLMTAFMFGDMRLAAFDVMRTADWLVHNEGIMFHTTYSLLWVQMLRDVYMFTGDRNLLVYCRTALGELLDRFETYTDSDCVIQTPPDYMFVDWVVTLGYSMHHPPKALGQSVLNAFYYGALRTAEDIYGILADGENAQKCSERAGTLREAFIKTFYDAERELFFDGLTDSTPNTKYYLPANINVRNFSRYPNVLAVQYGIVEGERAKGLLKRVLESGMPQVQPYFMHFVLEAVDKVGLFGEYGMKILDMWKPLVAECSKGLKEGWFAPEEGYSFDHSHAWGGTALYQLSSKLLGFKMLRPGFREISLSPNLYGLGRCKIVMPTPFGDITCRMEKGRDPEVSVPAEIACKVYFGQ